MRSVIEPLNPRECKVLRLRFGLDDGWPRSLEKVGREFGVTRELIRRVEARALLKLCRLSRSKRLRNFIEAMEGEKKYPR